MKHILVFLIIFLNLYSISFSQGIKKIELNTGYQVVPEDIIQGNPKTIGYTIYTTNFLKFGVFDIDNSNIVTNSKSYEVNNVNIELVKLGVEVQNWHINSRFLLARYMDQWGKWSPVIVETNSSNGSVNWAKKITIPNLNTYNDFSPVDFVIGLNEIRILCVGNNYTTGGITTPISSLFVINFDLNSYNYTIEQLYDPNNLTNVYTEVSFIKNYHLSSLLYGHLSISGLQHVHQTNTYHGFIYEEDVFSNQYFKSFILNHKSTVGFQVNGFDANQCIHVSIQNSDNEVTFYKPIDLINTFSTWKTDYKDTDLRFFLSNYGHGVKETNIQFNDYFVGLYNPNSNIDNGYGFIRIDVNNGLIDQKFYYDSKVETLFNMTNSYADGIDEYGILSPAPQLLSSWPYLYLLIKNLSSAPTPCNFEMRFDQIHNILIEQSQSVVKFHSGPFISTSLNVIELNVPVNVIDLCTDPINDNGGGLDKNK